MSKKVKIAIVILIVLVLGSIFVLFLFKDRTQNNAPFVISPDIIPEDDMVGDDRDEHGCIPSAGYSWCESQKRCLRIWETPCYPSVEEEIEHILADKYGKDVSEVSVGTMRKSGDYVTASVFFGRDGGQGEGGLVLAFRDESGWQVVFDGNGSVDCDKMRQAYGFPDEILRPNFCD